MALFGGNKKADKKNNNHSTTIITECTQIHGSIKGCGMIHIDGAIHGNLEVEEVVVVGLKGFVYGDIRSKKVIIGGTVEGSIVCDLLEVRQTGTVSDKITAQEMIADGTVNAEINVEKSIHITDNAHITTNNIQSKHIIVNGHIEGNLTATKLLEINKNGRVKGQMVVKKIKVSEGGLMLGTMLTYDKADYDKMDAEEPVELAVKNEKEVESKEVESKEEQTFTIKEDKDDKK
jgi:cytoskeletal protein CcmA (bactofilin family)